MVDRVWRVAATGLVNGLQVRGNECATCKSISLQNNMDQAAPSAEACLLWTLTFEKLRTKTTCLYIFLIEIRIYNCLPAELGLVEPREYPNRCNQRGNWVDGSCDLENDGKDLNDEKDTKWQQSLAGEVITSSVRCRS